MNILKRLNIIFNRILKIEKNDNTSKLLNETNAVEEVQTTENNLNHENSQEFPQNEIVQISKDGILDTNSPNAIEALEHNLKVLINRTKKLGHVEKFVLIREDDFFPQGWNWDKLSKTTNLEKVCTKLSYETRKKHALREAGFDNSLGTDGFRIPTATQEQINAAMMKVDKSIGNFLLPSRFRSTKHFTVNTPLEITGDYNAVSTNRDYIIIDDINNFINSNYGYSISYHDAYLDVTHEKLPISENAVVLIKDENYDRIMAEPKVAEELTKRRVIRYKGETFLAVNMALSELGVLPSKIGRKYADYDIEITDIIDNSMKRLANENGLFFDRSHSGNGSNGHFSSYYDDKNQDYQIAVRQSIDFLIKKFPEQEQLFNRYIRNGDSAEEIVEQIGVDKLIDAINEYNETVSVNFSQVQNEYNQDKNTIKPKTHEQFTKMVSLINTFYTNVPFDSNYEGKEELESSIQQFFQGNTIQEQQQAMKETWKYLRPKILELQGSEKTKQSDLLIIESEYEERGDTYDK